MQELPGVCRLLVRAAGWLMPSARRQEWRTRREYELWSWWTLLSERNELTPRRRREIYRFALGSFADALWSRFDREETAARMRSFLRGPVFLLGSLALLLAGIVAVSGGLRGLRSYGSPLGYPQAHELVQIAQERSMGHPHSVQQRAFLVWRDKATSFSDIAGFTVGWRRIDAFSSGAFVNRVTPNLFALLGVKPRLGRLPLEGDDASSAMITYDAWRWKADLDPKIIGKQLSFDDKQYRIVGVLPEQFRLLSGVVVPFEVENPRSRHLIGAIARLKPGVHAADAERELLRLLKDNNIRHYSKPRLTFLEQRRYWGLLGYGFGALFAIIIGIAIVTLRRPSLPAVSHANPRRRIAYWGFLVVKSMLLFTVLIVGWIEASRAVQMRFDPGPFRDLVSVVVFFFVFALACAVAVFWAFSDQRRRCPECLQRLTLPVTIGSWSSPLLEPVTTEMVCERGHGALCSPETQSSASEPDRWTALDSSWKELFTK